jgi:hypothetical protein
MLTLESLQNKCGVFAALRLVMSGKCRPVSRGQTPCIVSTEYRVVKGILHCAHGMCRASLWYPFAITICPSGRPQKYVVVGSPASTTNLEVVAHTMHSGLRTNYLVT